MSTLAERERALLADTLAELGPDQPTLCAGWQTRDLAAHVVVRERRPDAALGIALKPFAGHLRSVQDDAAVRPWPELVATLRRRSPLVVGPVDGLVNTIEMFVHLEDVRRAQPGWTARPADPELEEAAWRALRQRGRAFFRHSPVGVVLRRPDGTTHVAKDGPPSVTLAGPASELLLHAHGRTSVAQVAVEGDAADVAAFGGSDLAV